LYLPAWARNLANFRTILGHKTNDKVKILLRHSTATVWVAMQNIIQFASLCLLLPSNASSIPEHFHLLSQQLLLRIQNEKNTRCCGTLIIPVYIVTTTVSRSLANET
jgi:hypothetical protein